LKVRNNKNEKTCFDNQYIFISFIFDIFYFLTLETVNFSKNNLKYHVS
jgi:hypothetical protein